MLRGSLIKSVGENMVKKSNTFTDKQIEAWVFNTELDVKSLTEKEIDYILQTELPDSYGSRGSKNQLINLRCKIIENCYPQIEKLDKVIQQINLSTNSITHKSDFGSTYSRLLREMEIIDESLIDKTNDLLLSSKLGGVRESLLKSYAYADEYLSYMSGGRQSDSESYIHDYSILKKYLLKFNDSNGIKKCLNGLINKHIPSEDLKSNVTFVKDLITNNSKNSAQIKNFLGDLIPEFKTRDTQIELLPNLKHYQDRVKVISWLFMEFDKTKDKYILESIKKHVLEVERSGYVFERVTYLSCIKFSGEEYKKIFLRLKDDSARIEIIRTIKSIKVLRELRESDCGFSYILDEAISNLPNSLHFIYDED